jgi:hypothetical protein
MRIRPEVVAGVVGASAGLASTAGLLALTGNISHPLDTEVVGTTDEVRACGVNLPLTMTKETEYARTLPEECAPFFRDFVDNTTPKTGKYHLRTADAFYASHMSDKAMAANNWMQLKPALTIALGAAAGALTSTLVLRRQNTSNIREYRVKHARAANSFPPDNLSSTELDNIFPRNWPEDPNEDY